MAPSHSSTASDAIMSDSAIEEAAGGAIDGRTELDAQEIDGTLDATADMVDVFVDRPGPSNQSAQKTADDLADHGEVAGDEIADQLFTGDARAGHANSLEDVPEETKPTETSATHLDDSRDAAASSQQPQDGDVTKEDAGKPDEKSDGDHAASAAASAAAFAAVAASSAIATSTVPTMQLPTGMTANPTPYSPFTPFPSNGSPIVPHSLTPVPTTVGRRAVRIAPMGALPLPPQSNVTTSLMPDLANSNTGGIVTNTSSAQVTNVESPLNTLNTSSGTTGANIGEMAKGKRRGVSGSGPISTEGMTPEERTKQKRMLRNRESAARSRDKRKSKNIQLETSIEKHNKKKAALDEMILELQDVVDSMKQVLKRHKIPLIC